MKLPDWWPPRDAKQGILFFSPAVASLLALWVAQTWINEERFQLINRAALLSLGTMTAFSLPLALILTRNQSWRIRIPNTLGAIFFLVILNSIVAFGGCAVVSVATNALSR